MKVIKDLIDQMDEELCGAKDYAEKYVMYKSRDDGQQWASRFKEMANDELRHSMNIHQLITEEVDRLSKVFTPPQEMMDKWEKSHKEYVEKAAWIKQMLSM